MDSTLEAILKALAAVIDAGKPAGAGFVRNTLDLERIPSGGLLCLRDGEPGEPERLLSPPYYYYEHGAELDVVVDAATAGDPDAVFDACKRAVGAALAADRTLGGLVDWCEGEAPAAALVPLEGAPGWKAATIRVGLMFGCADPLL